MRQYLLIAASVALIGAAVWLGVGRSPQRPHVRAITALAISSSGEWLASGTTDGHVRLWNLARLQPVRQFEFPDGYLNDLRFDPQERYLAVANRNVTLVPLAGAAEIHTLRDDLANYGAVRFTSDGRVLVTITGRGAIVAIETATGKATEKVCCSTVYGDVAVTPDDKLLIAAGHWPGVWDFELGSLIGRLTPAREFLTFGPIAIDASRNLIFMGSQDGRVHVWDLRTRQFLRTSPAQSGYVTTISILGQTGWVAYAGQGDAVRMWNIERGESRVELGARATSNLVFDASRNCTAFGTESGELEFWDLIAGRRKNDEK